MQRFPDFIYERHMNNDTGKYNLDKMAGIKALTWHEVCEPESQCHSDPRHIHEGKQDRWFTPKDDDFDAEPPKEIPKWESKTPESIWNKPAVAEMAALAEKLLPRIITVVPDVPVVPVSEISGNSRISNSNQGLLFNFNPCGVKDNTKAYLAAQQAVAVNRIRPAKLFTSEKTMYDKGYQQALDDVLKRLDSVAQKVPSITRDIHTRAAALNILVMFDDEIQDLKDIKSAKLG
jgi:hypothetical protein